MQVTKHEPGTPSWVDVTGPDVGALAGFYSSLFGWDAQDQGEEAGHYTMFSVGGRPVAAASPAQPGSEAPPAWLTYITVDDADVTAKRAAELGGTVSVEPFDLPVGRTAILNDPAGAVFSVIDLADPT